MSYVRAYWIVVGINMLIAFAVFFGMPDYRGYLLHEDSLIENLTAFLFFLSSCIGFLFFLRSKLHCKALIIVSMVSFLGFLDELSFGERLFKLDMPRIYGVKIDAAHDFFYLAYKVIIKPAFAYSTYLILFLSIGTMFVTILLVRYRDKVTKITTNIFQNSQFTLLLFFTIFIFCALVIDLDLIHSNVLFMVEELFEMNAAFALLMCSLSLKEQPLSDKAIGRFM